MSWLSLFEWTYEDYANCLVRKSGYVCRRSWDKSRLCMDAEIMKHAGLWEPNKVVNHKNSCRMDHRVENLRMATLSQHRRARRPTAQNISGLSGVTLHRPGWWRVSICVGGSSVYLGSYQDIEEAKAVRVAAEIEHFGDFRYDPTDLCPLWETQCPYCQDRAKMTWPTIWGTLTY